MLQSLTAFMLYHFHPVLKLWLMSSLFKSTVLKSIYSNLIACLIFVYSSSKWTTLIALNIISSVM